MNTLSLIRHKQSGAALPVALVMLLISTMLGLASIRSATIQEKMSVNMYDRSLAYQGAEAALREAEDKIFNTDTVSNLGVNCTEEVAAKLCPSIPRTTFSGDSEGEGSAWQSIDPDMEINQDFLSEKSIPQYYIQRIGRTAGLDELGKGRSANDDSYESLEKSTPDAMLFRITARSHDPSRIKNRSIVALQITVKKNI